MEVIKSLGACGRYSVNVIRWKEAEATHYPEINFWDIPVVDVRVWQGEQHKNGVCLTNEMAATLLLETSKGYDAKMGEPIKKGTFAQVDFFIYEKIATLHKIGDVSMLFTKSSFRKPDDLRFDLRYWKKDMTAFSPGASLTPAELNDLCVILARYVDEAKIKIPKVPYIKKGTTEEDLIRQLLVLQGKSYLFFDEKVAAITKAVRQLIEEAE